MCGKSSGCHGAKIGFWLVVIGGLNWGLVGLGGFLGGNWNVVEIILGSWGWLMNLVYLLVGAATVMMLVGCKCKKCKVEPAKK